MYSRSEKVGCVYMAVLPSMVSCDVDIPDETMSTAMWEVERAWGVVGKN